MSTLVKTLCLMSHSPWSFGVDVLFAFTFCIAM